MLFFFFKQKTAYEIKECDWSSDVCSSDLPKNYGFLRKVPSLSRGDSSESCSGMTNGW